jgi:hypothetical protein
VDDQLRQLLTALAAALVWRDGERPRRYGSRMTQLRVLLDQAAASGDLGPLLAWLTEPPR